MDLNLLHLLAQGESSHVDYKSAQYRFIDASIEEKSELLKDILAMANAWRDTDAYILVGVKEIAGHKAEPVGITEHLNDAHLQEFVNQKTNRPIHFSYGPFEVEGRSIAVLHIPLQQRPFFLRRRFGPLDPDKVYLRRGSSTDLADADEIHAMGASSTAPSRPVLHVEFADLRQREPLGQSLALKRNVLRPLPDETLPPDPENRDTILVQNGASRHRGESDARRRHSLGLRNRQSALNLETGGFTKPRNVDKPDARIGVQANGKPLAGAKKAARNEP